ncbi:MAG TPA: hypothetical protein VGJ70_24380 [Solirubrobacteraceae bacterium]
MQTIVTRGEPPVGVRDLTQCDEIFLTSTAGGIMPLVELDVHLRPP